MEPLKRQSPLDLDSDALVAEVTRLCGKKRPLTAAAQRLLRDEHARTIAPAHLLALEAQTLECRVSDLVRL